MSDTLRLLEDRVRMAAERLKQLRGARQGLAEEIESLRRRVTELETAAAAEGTPFDEWERERGEVAAELQTVLTELRKD